MNSLTYTEFLFESSKLFDNHENSPFKKEYLVKLLSSEHELANQKNSKLFEFCQTLFTSNNFDTQNEIIMRFLFGLLLDLPSSLPLSSSSSSSASIKHCPLKLFLIKQLSKHDCKIFNNYVDTLMIIDNNDENLKHLYSNIIVLYDKKLLTNLKFLKNFFIKKLLINHHSYFNDYLLFNENDIDSEILNTFQLELKLSYLICNNLRTNNVSISSDELLHFGIYCQRLFRILENRANNITNSMQIQLCLVVQNLWLLLNDNNVKTVYEDRVEYYLSNEFSKLSVKLILFSTFIIESKKSDVLMELQPDIESEITKYCFPPTQLSSIQKGYDIHNFAFLLYNWLECLLINAHLIKFPTLIINFSHGFAVMNWIHCENIHNIQSIVSLLLKLYQKFLPKSQFITRVRGEFLLPFISDEFNNLLFRLFVVAYKAITDHDDYFVIFKDILMNEYNLQNSIKKLLRVHSVIEVYDDQDSYVNVTIKNIDFIDYISIRLKLFHQVELTDILVIEFSSMLKEWPFKYSEYFIKIILPKLFKHDSKSKIIVKEVLSKILMDQFFSSSKFELILLLLELNQKEKLNVIDESKFVEYLYQSFSTSVPPDSTSVPPNSFTIPLLGMPQDFGNEGFSFFQCARTKKMLSMTDSYNENIGIFDDVDLNIRILSIIIENNNHDLNQMELDLIFNLFQKSITIQHAYGRDRLVKLFRVLLMRISKNKSQEIYLNFLTRISDYCLQSLHPNQYFGSILIKLKILKSLFNEYGLDIDKISSTNHEFIDRNLLIFLLQHDLLEIRYESKNLLLKFLKLKLIQFSDDEIKSIKELASEMLEKIQPNLVIHGVLLKRFTLSFDHQINNDYSMTVYKEIEQLTNELNSRIKIINEDGIMISIQLPTYPKLSMIFALIHDEIDNDPLSESVIKENNEIWHNLLENLIQTCIDSCNSISMVVCDESPEGFLPGSIDKNEFDMEYLCLISQMLLLNSWMTIKESVLILCHLVHKFSNHQLLSCENIEKIIDFLYQNQLNLVHRGAFEQCSNNFNSLMTTILKNNCEKCHKKIETILSDTMNQLFPNDDENIEQNRFHTITRRSAGIPFIIQSIIGANPTASYCKIFIDKIIEAFESETKVYSWQIIHMLNILKTLVNDNRLTKLMSSYLEKLLKINIEWSDRLTYYNKLVDDGEIFSIQNSVSLLFASLLTRIFGVKRNRDDTSNKNYMSSLLFFHYYPSLYQFMFDKLEISVQRPFRLKKSILSIQSILIILSKLIMSKSVDNVYDVENFLPLIKKLIYNCQDSRVRNLAVRTYCRLSLFITKFHSPNQIENLSKMIEKLNLKMKSQDFCENYNKFESVALLSSKIIEEFVHNSNHLKVTHDLISVMMNLYANIRTIISNESIIYDGIIAKFYQTHYRLCFYFKSMDIYMKYSYRDEEIIEENFKKLINEKNNSESYQQMDISNINLIIDFLIQFEFDIKKYAADFEKFSSQSRHLDAKLMFWIAMNEMVTLAYSKDQDLKRLKHYRILNLDSIHFFETIQEFLRMQKFLLNKKYNGDSNELRIHYTRQSETIVDNILSKSIEIEKFFRQKEPLLIIEYEILNEIFLFLYMTKCSNILDHIQSSFLYESRDFSSINFSCIDFSSIMQKHPTCYPTLLLVTCELASLYETSEYSKKILDVIERLANKHENVFDRLIALQCLITIIERLVTDGEATRYEDFGENNYVYFKSSALVRIFINFLNHLQDNEIILRKQTKFFIEKLLNKIELNADRNLTPEKKCINLFVYISTKTYAVKSPLKIICSLIKIALHYLANNSDEDGEDLDEKLFDN